ncbi:MAG: hypothetical protein FGM32_08535 [Candidatus Kapabacteria bacterium]|nr:hypothetical protein [Candidatus Kapabacteria bacterium]
MNVIFRVYVLAHLQRSKAMRLGQILFAVKVAIMLSGCGSPTVVVPDPCEGAQRVTARFTMYEVLESGTIAPSDVTVNGLVRFAADERYDSYEWQIGSDSRIRTDRSFQLRFPGWEAPRGIPIPIRFIGRRKPDTTCFPDDDGVDTAYRELLPIFHSANPFVGSYHGAHVDDPADTFTVTIYVRYHGNSRTDMCSYVMRNINKGCSDTTEMSCSAINDKRIGATIMEFDGDGAYITGTGCLSPKGIARLKGRDTIEIDYVYDRARIPKKFIGRRVK